MRKGDPEACFAVAYTNASIVNIATNAQGLISDYLIAQDDVATVVISNLASGNLYSLLCYGAGIWISATRPSSSAMQPRPPPACRAVPMC